MTPSLPIVMVMLVAVSTRLRALEERRSIAGKLVAQTSSEIALLRSNILEDQIAVARAELDALEDLREKLFEGKSGD